MDTAFQMAEIGQSENSEDRVLAAGKALQEALRVAQTAQWAPTSLKTMDDSQLRGFSEQLARDMVRIWGRRSDQSIVPS